MITTQIQDIVLFKLEGALVYTAVEEFKENLQQRIQSGSRKIAVDLSEVELITSSCLGLLYTAHQDLKAKGGKLVLVAPGKPVLQTIQDWRLDRLFPICKTLEELSKAFGSVPLVAPMENSTG